MRYGFLALGVLGGCTMNETSTPVQVTVEHDEREARSLNFSEIAADQQDNLFATIGERLRNYREDEDVVFDKGVRSSFFPRKGVKGRLQAMRIRSDRVIFEYSDYISQGVPGYEGLTLTASRRIVFRYQVTDGYVAMERVEGGIQTAYSSRAVGLIAGPILAQRGIDPEIDIKKIIIGDFEGVNPAAFIADPDKKRFALLDLVKREFLEPRSGYQEYDSAGTEVDQEDK